MEQSLPTIVFGAGPAVILLHGGGGYSTVEDLLKFSDALLGNRLLNPETTELLLSGKVEIQEGVRNVYSFMDKTIEGQRVVGHGGKAPGVCNFMDVYLDPGYTTIILSNTDGGCLSVREFIRENPLRTTS